MGSQFSQIFPPAPTFTETSLPSLKGKVYIVTGASAGVGKELARLLYSAHGTVYAATRSADKTNAAILWIKQRHPESQGQIHFLRLDLNDLEGIKPTVDKFLSKESRLDVLFNNAGVLAPPQGSKTKQGYELQLGTNCIAPFLFTKLLTPLLVKTARTSETGSVRVIWVSSSAASLGAPTGGIDMSNLDYKKDLGKFKKYAISKGGNVLHALEFQRRYEAQGIRSISLNPGNLKSDIQRHVDWFLNMIFRVLLHEPVYGAYTELFAGLAPGAANIREGEWVIPWGCVSTLRKDYVEEGKSKAFWEWSEKQVERYI